MEANRIWTIGSIVLMVVIVAAGWLLGIQPQLAAADAANQSRAQVHSSTVANQAVLEQLKKDYQGLDQLKQQLAALRQAVPAQADASAFVTELNALASAHQVTVKSIVVSDAKPYSPPPAAPASPAPSASPAPTASPSPAPPPAGTAPGASNPQITAANFIVIPVQVTVSGPYGNVLDFVAGLQTGQRLFLVTAFSSGVATAGPGPAVAGTTASTVSGFMYVLLNR
ncbi:MAG: hypothetical protein ACYCZK_02310 [Microbacteriaceae bacterium]